MKDFLTWQRGWTTEEEETDMKSSIRTTTVDGKKFTVWADYSIRGMCAEDENGNIKKIHGNGYLSNELSIRKAIAACFGLQTFRK